MVAGAADAADQELRHAASGGAQVGNISEGAVLVEVATRPGRLQGGEVHVLIFKPSLEAVLAENLGKVVRNLEGLADFVRRQEVVAAQGGQIADLESRKAAVLGQSADRGISADTILRRNARNIALGSEARGVQVSESSAHLIDGVGSKHMGPSRNRLIGFRGLEALVEGAAIGDAAEDTRNEYAGRQHS